MALTGTKAVVAAMLCFLISGCDDIPTHNFDNHPLSITADGREYVTCGPYSLSDDGGFGQNSYTIGFRNAVEDNSAVMLRGVKKLTIVELPAMVPAPMPTFLPDIRFDHPQGGGPYQEDVVYTWADGSQAIIHNGAWQSVKRRNTVCGTR